MTSELSLYIFGVLSGEHMVRAADTCEVKGYRAERVAFDSLHSSIIEARVDGRKPPINKLSHSLL